MIRTLKTKKRIAIFFLGLLAGEMLTPALAHALTSGPAQPETKQFVAAGTSELVDLFTGDFKYNIPLLDIEGYPVNLNYASGVGMDDEASWVGLGWNLNVGAITRNIRGVADDADGDMVNTETYFKPQITYGGRGTLRAELSGYNVAGLQGSLTVGVFSDNYTGLGAEFGWNAGLSLTAGGWMTASMNVEALSNTSSGVDKRRNVGLSFRDKSFSDELNVGIAVKDAYNSRRGLKERTLSASYGANMVREEVSATFNYNTPAFYPRAANNIRSKDMSFSSDVGGAAFLLFAGGGVSGYKRSRELADKYCSKPAYGMLYADKGKDNQDALMDFIREKEVPVVKGLPNLPIPIATPDIFTYTAQGGSGQFRVFSGGAGVMFDPASKSVSDVKTIGGDLGLGYAGHAGVTFYMQDINSATGKWNKNNAFVAKGDFPKRDELEPQNEEAAYFKEAGELNVADPNFVERVKEEELVSVKLNKTSATAQLRNGSDVYAAPESYKKDGRQPRTTAISYLTAKEAAAARPALESFPFNNVSGFEPPECNNFKTSRLPRCYDYRKPSHISEVTVQGTSGARMVYGIPVYNISQTEYTFAVNPSVAHSDQNLVDAEFQGQGFLHNAGLDNYYNRERQPGYASSFLLTSILSPDYSDITGDGISADDNGTAYKFNYSRLPGIYKWRTPIQKDKANYNKGLYADVDDDKGSVVYGEKELWYTHSIESKNMVAYFITEDRSDGLGVVGPDGTIEPEVKQKRLKEIRLYAKNDLETPVKTVVFHYGYDLCKGVPNQLNTEDGKLTLLGIHFEYGSSHKGKFNAYSFDYNQGEGAEYDYQMLATDRWGTFKSRAINNHEDYNWELRNDEFPYTIQDKESADKFASAWNLKTIHLPSGGSIEVTYESDDYAYVQDKRAMQMTHIKALLKDDGSVTSKLEEARGLRISVPDTDAGNEDETSWFKKHYLDNNDVIFTKLYVNVTDKPLSDLPGSYDFVPCYGTVIRAAFGGSGNDKYADVWFKERREGDVSASPMLLSAWQKMKEEYPMYAYPGYKDRVKNESDIEKVLKQLVHAIGNLSELKENFYKRAQRKGFASMVNVGKSTARIVKSDGMMLGGGCRVKKLLMKDNWGEMAGSTDVINTGQVYEYTTTLPGNEDGEKISSGVAAYEPHIGGDENAMHLPVDYVEPVEGGLDNYYYLEKPFGEYLYPSPQVGYSKVTIRRLDQTGEADNNNLTGYDVSEFYTARDFPVIVKSESMPDTYSHQSQSSISFFGGNVVSEKIMSQGYVIILNDMHGKPRSQKSYNRGGALIASTEFEYAKEPYNGNSFRLTNKVKVVDEKANIAPEEQIIGREIEMHTYMREEETKNFGETLAHGLDLVPILAYIIPIPHWPRKENKEYRLYRSASVLKTVQYSGVVVAVRKMVDGSVITAENELFDKFTGAPVVTSTQNEFNDPVYTLNIPAYWIYPKMGGAYQNFNRVFKDVTTNVNGDITSEYTSTLVAGDEFLNVDNGERLWVIKDTYRQTTMLIDELGLSRKNYTGTLKLCRSGYRNVLGAAASTITSLKNPVNGAKLAMISEGDLSAYNVIQAGATLFDEAWGRPGCVKGTCPPGYEYDDFMGLCIKFPETNNADYLNLCNTPRTSSDVQHYNSQGAVFYNNTAGSSIAYTKMNAFWGQPPAGETHTFYYGLLTSDGGRFCGNDYDYANKWTGVEGKFHSTGGVKYIGISGNGDMRVYINNHTTPVISRSATAGAANYQKMHVYPVTLQGGDNMIWVEGKTDDPAGKPINMTAHVFNTPLPQLKDATDHASAGTIWSLNDPKELTPSTYILANDGTIIAKKYTCSGGPVNGLTIQESPYCDGFFANECQTGYTSVLNTAACAISAAVDNRDIFQILEGETYDSDKGAWFVDADNKKVGENTTAAFWKPCGNGKCGRLNETGIRFGDDDGTELRWVDNCFTIPVSGTYYIGYGGTSGSEVFIDNILINSKTGAAVPNTERWVVKPVYLNAGRHNVRLTAKRSGETQGAVVGMELYNNTYEQIRAGAAINILYSSHNLINKQLATFYQQSDGTVVPHFSGGPNHLTDNCGAGTPYYGAVANGDVINPYVYGYLGNWRPSETKVVETNRKTGNLFGNTTATGLDVRNSGAYQDFTAFWYMKNGSWSHDVSSAADNSDVLWVTSNYITRYDQYGTEIENKNALGIYSGAAYSFNKSLPSAVATNARSREIFYESFDDYYFNKRCNPVELCSSDDFKFGLSAASISTEAHSGKYSCKVGSGFDLTALVHTEEHAPGKYIGVKPWGEYFKRYTPGLYKEGFSPMPDRRYVFSAWVKNSNPKQQQSGLSLLINGQSRPLNKKAAVEGWVLVEEVIDFGALTFNNGIFSLGIRGNGDNSLLIDDVRIMPFDGQMKSFTYDDRTMKLMAELDENNYATFYEYDDEGTLVRVKKETERGILTIKESRSAYRKKEPLE